MRALPMFLMAACAADPTPPADTDVVGVDANFGVEETEGIDGCDNLLPDCFYPFPSRALIAPDGRIAPLPPEAVPVSGTGGTFSTDVLSDHVGFGTASPILWRFAGAVLPADIGPFDPSRSVSDDAVVVVIDAATGARIPHWVEPDVRAADADPPVWVIRPSIPLPRGTEIVVGVRGLTDAAGTVLPAAEAFAPLRDATASRHLGVHARRPHFEDVVFPTLDAAGFARDQLQLAWSFPTQSGDRATALLLAVRDAIFAALPTSGPPYTLERVLECTGVDEPADCPPGIRVVVDGTVDVPSVMLPPDDLGIRRIRRDSDGRPVVEGAESWPFRLQLPDIAFTGPDPVPVLQYGHGFLGSRGEANNGWLREQAQRQGFAILATDMQGMSNAITTTWLNVLLRDGGRFPQLAELALQGVVNQLVQQRMVRTSLAQDARAAFRRDDDRLAWDPDTVWYAGNSQGGSVGTVVMATSLDVTRGLLGVPGSGYPFLLHRSTVFDAYDVALRTAYPEPDAISRFLGLLGTGFDAFDPLTFAPHMHGDPLPGTPDHEVLLHVAKEDQQVVNEASFILGRAAGGVLMTPAVRPVFGLPEQPYPASPGAAVVEVDFGIPDDPTPLDPPDGDPADPAGSDTHGWLRRFLPAQDQMTHFLRTGEVIDVCEGEPCVTDGAP